MTIDATIPFDPTTPEQRENPFDVLALARREQPVFHAPALDLWVVTRHEDVLAVLKDHRTFSSAGALKSSSTPLPPAVLDVLAEGFPGMPYIIELDPPLHDRIRGLVARAFTPRRISELELRGASCAGASCAEPADERVPAQELLLRQLVRSYVLFSAFSTSRAMTSPPSRSKCTPSPARILTSFPDAFGRYSA